MANIKFKNYTEALEEKPKASGKKREIAKPKLDKKNKDPHKRPDFKIVRCCQNCKYKATWDSHAQRFACRWPYKSTSALMKATGVRARYNDPLRNRIEHEDIYQLPLTTATCVCDRHAFNKAAIKPVTEFCGAEYHDD